MLLLYLHGLLVEIEAHESRFAALPHVANSACAVFLGFPHEDFKRFFAHAVTGVFRVFLGSLAIEAVITEEIAVKGRRLDQI